MPQDPVSKREYEDSIEGFKHWAENELPHGLPLLYAVVGFVTITSLFTIVSTVISWLTTFSMPMWGWVVIAILGVFWAQGGWTHGQEAQDDLNKEPHHDSEWRY